MLNSVVLIGRLTADPELRKTNNGISVTTFTLAVDRIGRGEADFIRCVCWRGTAEAVANHMSKGRMVAVEGRIQVRPWETDDGNKRTTTEVIAHRVQFLGGGERRQKQTEEPGPDPEFVDAENDEELPF